MIPIYIPYINKYNKSAIKAIKSSWISDYGKYVTKAEDKLKQILNVNYCLLMNSGTAATHCLFLALKYIFLAFKYIFLALKYIFIHI